MQGWLFKCLPSWQILQSSCNELQFYDRLQFMQKKEQGDPFCLFPSSQIFAFLFRNDFVLKDFFETYCY